MTRAAHVSSSVDVFAEARRDLESLFERLTTAGACSHVVLGELITEGWRRSRRGRFRGTLMRCLPKSLRRWSSTGFALDNCRTHAAPDNNR